MLTPKEILQIDATVIAGLLILIGVIISSGQPFEEAVTGNEEGPWERFNPENPKDWGYFGGTLFGVSALLAVVGSVVRENNRERSSFYYIVIMISIAAMGGGFASLAWGFFLFG